MKKQKTKITFKLHAEVELPDDFINSVPMSGPADNAVSELREVYDVECSLDDSKEYLKTYGAWSDEELSDLDSNIDRLIWIACLDCQEQKTNYWYMGG